MTLKNGLPCKRCGTSDWYRSGGCKRCGRDYKRQWKQANPDKMSESKRRYRQENRDKVAEYGLRWRQANRDKIAEYSRRWKGTKSPRRWNKNRRDKSAEYSRRYRQANQEKVAEYGRNWRQANRDNGCARSSRYRTRQTKAGGSYTAAEWKELCNHYGNKCLRCGRDDVKLTADHVRPVSMGGSSDIDNIQPLCGPCNSGKRDRHIDYRPNAGIARWIQAKLFG